MEVRFLANVSCVWFVAVFLQTHVYSITDTNTDNIYLTDKINLSRLLYRAGINRDLFVLHMLKISITFFASRD